MAEDGCLMRPILPSFQKNSLIGTLDKIMELPSLYDDKFG